MTGLIFPMKTISSRNENHLVAELPSNVTLLAYSPRLETSKKPGPRKELMLPQSQNQWLLTFRFVMWLSMKVRNNAVKSSVTKVIAYISNPPRFPS